MKRAIIISVLIFICANLFAQPTETTFLKGNVNNSDGLPLAGAVISLFRLPDSVLVKGVVTNESGDFSINKIGAGNYFVKISFSGFGNYLSDKLAVPAEGLVLTPVKLAIADKSLTTVVVYSKKPVIEQKIDATVLNVNELVLKEANNAFEVLRFAPNINLSDNEDNIEMNGKNYVEVRINGKVERLTGRDLVKLLKSIPAGSVSAVDIISSPSSKYDIPGNAGIINIRLKKVLNAGINGSVNISGSKSVNNMGDLSNSLNYGLGKLYLTSYLAYHYGRYRTQYSESRLADPYGTPTLLDRQNTHIDRWSDPVVRIGADWYINPKHTIGALIELEKSTNKTTYSTLTNIGKPGAVYDSAINTSSSAPNARTWNTYNLNYRFADTTGSEFNFDIDKSYYKKTNDNSIATANSKIISPFESGPSYLFNSLEVIDILTFKADYTKNFKSKLRVEAGFKLSFVNNENDQEARIAERGNANIDTGRTNFFTYKERVNAAYATISKRFKKWGLQAGVRIEHTTSEGIITNLKNTSINKPDTSYLNILPSAYLSYNPNMDNALRLSFTQRIKRPDYEDLEPLDYQVDRFYYHLGNPGLRVQKNTNLEFNYTHKNKLVITAAYVKTTDYFTNVLYQKQGVLYETIQNTGKLKNFNASISYPLRPAKWWSSDNRVTIFNNHFTGPLLEGYLDEGKWSYTLYTSQRFVLAKKYILRLTMRYNAPQQRLYFFDESSGSVNLSLGRQIFKQKGTIRIGVSDIFRNQRTFTTVNFGSLKYTQRNTWESRSFSIDFSFRFGSTKIKEPRERETGNSDEKNRAK